MNNVNDPSLLLQRKKIAEKLSTIFNAVKYPYVLDEVNIWEEPLSGNIEYDNNAVVCSATLNQLIYLVTSPYTPSMDDFTEAFFTTFVTFCTPNQLLAKFFERYEPKKGENYCDEETLKEVRRSIIRCFHVWIYHNPDFFCGISKENPLSLFFDLLNSDGYSNHLAQLRAKISKLNREKEVLSIPKIVSNTKTSILDVDSLEIAQQLSLKAFTHFSQIKSKELYGQLWGKKNENTHKLHVIQAIDQFNHYSKWVSTYIVSTKCLRARTKVMSKLIDIGFHLLHLNNFHMAMAFISGLNHCSISRLTFTTSRLPKLSKKQLEEMEGVMSMEGSYCRYRKLLSSTFPPAIPYLGVCLQDITFIEDGNMDYVVRHMINFSKKLMLYNLMRGIRRFQEDEYKFRPNPQILVFLDILSPFADDALYRLSLKREPRNAKITDLD